MKFTARRVIPILILSAIILLCFSRILFTEKIVRAPDIINEFYWTVKDNHHMSFSEAFPLHLKADWDPYTNSGTTTEGGWASQQFLLVKSLIFWLIPAPVSIAWFMVLNLIFGAIGTYLYCRLIGTSRIAAFLGGLIFAIAPENASLINAGHVLKIATICFAPWVFYCYERAAIGRKPIWFLTTSIVLAFQFFQGHWQVAFYTCLALAVYGILRFILSAKGEAKGGILKLLAMNLVMILFFLSTVAISLAPLASWSKDTNRGVNSGENMGKGGLNRDEAMAWSMPPEEISTFVIPGFFGFSRQEAGENPSNIRSYYWGRMVFTQTTDYMGLLPWLLLPLPFIFRRDKYSWLALTGIVIGVLFSLGKFTPFYNILYDHLPGINRFRVPKMMMFIPVFGLSMLAARGIDCIKDERIRASLAFKRYIKAVWLLPLVLVLLLGVLYFAREFWLKNFMDILIQPTRYESGVGLVAQRWTNILIETSVAVVFAAIYAAILTLGRIKGLWRFAPLLLILLFLIDVGRVNSKFLFLTDVPQKATDSNTPVLDFLANQPGNYRTLPLADDPMPYSAKKIPVMFTSSPVQSQRWQSFLDAFSFNSSMPDLINLKYIVVPTDEYEKAFKPLANRYMPVFIAPDKSKVILENRGVLPKGWLVTSAFTVQDPAEVYNIIQNPQFNAGNFAIVESPPTVQLEHTVDNSVAGSVETKKYSGEELIFSVNTFRNAIFIIGEKYAEGWKAFIDGTQVPIQQVDYILRGVYLTPGSHEVRFLFDPKSFKIGKWLTLGSFGIFAVLLLLELRRRKKEKVA